MSRGGPKTLRLTVIGLYTIATASILEAVGVCILLNGRGKLVPWAVCAMAAVWLISPHKRRSKLSQQRSPSRLGCNLAATCPSPNRIQPIPQKHIPPIEKVLSELRMSDHATLYGCTVVGDCNPRSIYCDLGSTLYGQTIRSSPSGCLPPLLRAANNGRDFHSCIVNVANLISN